MHSNDEIFKMIFAILFSFFLFKENWEIIKKIFFETDYIFIWKERPNVLNILI